MNLVYASLMLATVQAALVTVAPGPDESCPSSAQVLAAIELHAPSLVAARTEDDSAGQTTLVLSPVLATGDISFFLLDRAGRVKLYRTLPPPAGDRARNCAALADTVAFVVDRYFNEVELPTLPERKTQPKPAPPAPPKPPFEPVKAERTPNGEAARYLLSLSAGRRIPGAAVNLGGNEIDLAAGLALAGFGQRGGRLWLETSAGALRPVKWIWQQNSLTTSRVGWNLSVLLGWPWWRGRLYGGATSSVEYIWLDADTSDGRHQHEARLASAAGLKAGYLLFLLQHVFVRADLVGDVAIVRYEFPVQSGTSALLNTPSIYVTAAIGVGISF
jgi:hypothetical protein